MASLDERLTGYSKEDLILLVKEMIAQHPHLAHLLDLPLHPDGSIPLDLDAVARQVRYVLNREDAVWVGREWERLIEMANRYLETDAPTAAGAIYHLILSETLSRFEDWWPEWDENAGIWAVLGECADGLGKCLEQVHDPAIRQPWLEVLLEADLKDTRLGGIDFAWPAGEVVLRQATDEEWPWIEARVRQEMDRSEGWTREVLVKFLSRRLVAAGREAEADALVLEHGTPSQQAFLLLRLGRVEEAVEIARQHFADLPGLVAKFADALVSAGHGEAAEAYMAEQASNERFSTFYLPWLARYFEEHGDRQAALDAWRRQFEASPALETYQELRRLAGELGTWESLRPTLLNALDPIGQAWLLLNIALDEGDVIWGLEIVSRPGARLFPAAQLRLAQAAESDHPRAALEIYRSQAERIIAARDRPNYQVAADLLLRVRELHRRLDEEATWQTYITRLREENRRLRALRKELDSAGLSHLPSESE